MKTLFRTGLSGMGILFLLAGCAHVELPLPGDTSSSSRTHGSSSSHVDVSGVGDGVASENIVVKRIPFPVDEYSGLKSMGNGAVKGSISITSNGARIQGRQTRLYLNPVTRYSSQWYRESYLGGHKMGKSDPRLFNYLKFTASDNKGDFAFYGVPAGDYYIVGTVKCAACGGKNIRIARKVHVGSSGTVRVDLSKAI